MMLLKITEFVLVKLSFVGMMEIFISFIGVITGFYNLRF